MSTRSPLRSSTVSDADTSISGTSRSSIHIRPRWVKALGDLMNNERGTTTSNSNATETSPQQQQHQQGHREDKLGECITDILNQHSAFRYVPGSIYNYSRSSRSSFNQNNNSFSYPPLLSRHNLGVLYEYLLSCRNIVDFSNETPKEKLRNFLLLIFKDRQPMSNTLAFLFKTILTLIPFAAVVSHAFILYSFKAIMFVLSYLFIMLIDWHEIQQAMPKFVMNSFERVFQIAKWCDAYILFGQRYKGREWNRNEYCWEDPLTADSTKRTLWELPPPTIRQGRRLCLSSHHLLLTCALVDDGQQDQWSRSSVDHMVAVNFCYVMLREENLRKQARRRRKNSDAKKASQIQDSECGSLENATILQQQRNSAMAVLIPPNDGVTDNDGNDDKASSTLAVLLQDPGTPNINAASPTEAIELRAMSNTGGREGVGTGSTAQNELDLPRSPIISDYRSDASVNSNASDVAGDLPWIDVGAKIGMRLLNSAHVHRLASQETADRIMGGIGRAEDTNSIASDRETSCVNVSPVSDGKARSIVSLPGSATRLSKPVHSMWTSPAAAAPPLSPTSPTHSIPSAGSNEAKPPLSPRSPSLREGDAGISKWGYCSPSNSSEVSMNSAGISSIEEHLAPPTLNRLSLPSIEVVGQSPMQVSPGGRRIWRPSDRKSKLRRHTPSRVLSSSKDSDVSRLTTASTHPGGEKRQRLLPGVKVAVPLFPIQPKTKGVPRRVKCPQFQMGTVVKSSRLYVGSLNHNDKMRKTDTNCLSVTVKLDKAFLRNSEFAELTFRVMDDWSSSRYMPKHSKVPIGSCVATSYGLGILVGWRVEDDSHVVRSLWQRCGTGSAHAYLNRNSIHATVEAAVGFDVQTKYGWGVVLAYVDGGSTFESGRFFVAIKEDGLHQGHVLELNRKDIDSCRGAQFLPIIEHIREGAHYQIQLDNYEAAVREQQYDDTVETDDEMLWRMWSPLLQILWNSFLKSVEEDKAFDEGMNEFMTSIIDFLEKLDEPADKAASTNSSSLSSDEKPPSDKFVASDFEVECVPEGADYPTTESEDEFQEPGFWIVNDFFGGVFRGPSEKTEEHEEHQSSTTSTDSREEGKKLTYYEHMFSFLRTTMKTVALAKAESVDSPQFRMALAITHEFLLFIRTIVKVQQKNQSVHSLEVWKRAFEEIFLTFGPIKDRMENICRGIALRMEKQGRLAKTRLLKFVDTLLGDEKLLFLMEQAEWDQCLSRVEIALIKSKIIQEESLLYFRKTGQFIYEHICSSFANENAAAARNNEKMALFAQFLQSLASPRRSILKVFIRDDVLELIERILVRVYCREDEIISRILTIHASNFQSLHHLRMLKDFSVSGKIWIPLLDAADEEFSWIVSHMPDSSKEFVSPLSSLFSLCVAQFHKMNDSGDLSKDWLDFLLEEDAVRIIQEIDMKLILALESFSRDVREMMVVLPYYPSIDVDILKLMDEVDLNAFLREASDAIDDPDLLSQFLREKATIAVERFLNYLPKMSIPVERRDLGDGWVLTCRGEDGNDLTLSDVKIKRENLICQILGGDTLFFPMFGKDDSENGETTGDDAVPASCSAASGTGSADTVAKQTQSQNDDFVEESILDHIRILLLQAQKYDCWKPGVGGVGYQPPSDRYVATVLQGLPVSSVLNCAIELWRNLEIDDDELLEIAIRDVSFQIKLQQQREESGVTEAVTDVEDIAGCSPVMPVSPLQSTSASSSSSLDSVRRRFNPRVDPTVLFLEMKNLTLNLDHFVFRIEKDLRRTVFDPVFEGRGMVALQNVSIRLRVECAKERVKRTGSGAEVSAPILQIQELSVDLENMHLKVKDTGFGSDWVLNRAVKVFENNITKVVEENLRDQIFEQCRAAVENMNSYFLVNPNMLLNLLGISMDDLEENIVWV